MEWWPCVHGGNHARRSFGDGQVCLGCYSNFICHIHSSDPAVSQVWYADDATGIGKCTVLRKWWDTLSQLGLLFGYILNASKTYLVVKVKYAAAGRGAFWQRHSYLY